MIVTASPNIAFVKYWGKLSSSNDIDRNLPCNPSLSMTLSKAQTTTEVIALPRMADAHEIFVGGQKASTQDYEKISAHLKRICEFSGETRPTFFKVTSNNNFPQGTGLASSASAYAALSLAGLGSLTGTASLEQAMKSRMPELTALARRGSGSACRSLEGPFVLWEGASASKIDCSYKLYDTILIFSRAHKKVPSSEGHKSAQSSPLFPRRLAQVPSRIEQMIAGLKKHSLRDLGPLLEQEALELHEIARSGTPSIIYLTEESQRFIDLLKTLKERDFYFTLDAGPNVHLISEQPIANKISSLLESHGFQCEIWEDEPGFGPKFS